MIAYREAYALLNDADFAQRVTYARLRAAAFIRIEDPETPDHVARAEWADKMLKEQVQMPMRQTLLYIITDSNIAANGVLATDAQIQGAVDAAIPYFVLGG